VQQRRLALGYCRDCGLPSGGKSYCEKHRAEHAAASRARYRRSEKRAADAAVQRARFARRRAQGLCVACSDDSPLPIAEGSRRLCEYHQERERRRAADRRSRVREVEQVPRDQLEGLFANVELEST
jgi:hypothetical protein